ncbi:hypothetical protein TCAL_10213 [Tigriopus californicus]|uniref:Uncharacterized protein n=1 Tax=Tigriopus californicus TaxID=6832 RepID=A0A553PGU9_TIGCA|nr:hypothetical protein TCAL_10213 [Tigriopus californicus]
MLLSWRGSLLTRDEALRDKLHVLRRNALQTLPIYKRPIYPNSGVPPASILAKMFPTKPLSELQTLTLAQIY